MDILKNIEYKQIFIKIDDCFQFLMRRLFVDQWLQESTKLLIAFVNETEKPKQMFLMEKLYSENYEIEVRKLDNDEEYVLAIDDYLDSKKYAKKNIKKELREFELLGCKMHVCCVCLSPCLDKNIGKFLLKQAFFTMVESLQSWCLKLEELERNPETGKLQDPADNNWHDFVQRVLQKTYERVNEQLEGLYSPVKMSYIISLSGEYYERTENSSNLLFLPQLDADDIKSSELKYDFRKKDNWRSGIQFVPENIRRIRKLTQIASNKLYLILQVQSEEQEYEALGICKKNSIKSLVKSRFTSVPYFICKTKGHMKWDLYLGERYIFSFVNGDYRITSNMPIEYLESKCRTVFPLEKVELTNVYDNVCEAQKQLHGTMLVILSQEHAKSESLRFSEGYFGMSDVRPSLRTDVLGNLSSIDGSILMDVQGNVYGIGVILDGNSDVKGKPERGARYNSALKYCKYLKRKKIPGLILIVSEDGFIDMIDTNAKLAQIPRFRR